MKLSAAPERLSLEHIPPHRVRNPARGPWRPNPMRSYWLRIITGALAIFAIGMIGVSMVRRGRDKVTEVVNGSGPLDIPLAFLPFQVDGNKLGTVEHLTISREAPRKLSSIHVEVKLEDSLVAHGLAGCRLAANIDSDSTTPHGDVNVHVGRAAEHTFFFCAGNDSSLTPFGTVTLNPGGVTVPLLLPHALAEKLQSGEWAHDSDSTSSADVLAERAESLADKAEAAADSVSEAQDKRETAHVVSSRFGDSLRAEGKRRADSLQRVLSRMADSLRHQ